MGITSPVLGLRPGRGGLSRTWKLPNPDSLTSTPRARDSRISSKNVSTMSLASRLFRPTRSNNSSANSAFVRVRSGFMMCYSLSPLAHAVSADQRLEQSCHALFHRGVVERRFVRLKPKTEGHALFGRLHRLVAPDIEQFNIFDDAKSSIRFNGMRKCIEQILKRYIGACPNGQVADHDGLARDLARLG